MSTHQSTEVTDADRKCRNEVLRLYLREDEQPFPNVALCEANKRIAKLESAMLAECSATHDKLNQRDERIAELETQLDALRDKHRQSPEYLAMLDSFLAVKAERDAAMARAEGAEKSNGVAAEAE